MRRFKIAIGILLGIALLTWWLTHRLDIIPDDLDTQITAVDLALQEDGDLAAACRDVEELWHHHKLELVRFVPQTRVDDITVTVVRLTPLSQMEERAEFEAEFLILKLKLTELWEAHSPSFTSLF